MMRRKRILTKEQKKKARIRHKNWVEKNRDRLNENVRRYRARRYAKNHRWLEEGPKAKALKSWYGKIKSNPCHDCGHKFPACCMDFDHRPGTKKKYCIGSMVAHHYNKKLIQKELKKCDLVCANCHRIRTRNRREGRRLNHGRSPNTKIRSNAKNRASK